MRKPVLAESERCGIEAGCCQTCICNSNNLQVSQSPKFTIEERIINVYIPYGRQTIDEADIEAVVKVLRSDFLTTGPKIAEFEHKVAEYTGARYAVAVSNGTAALHAACYAAGIGEGDEAVISPITFAATSNCVLYGNGKPVFADIDPHTWNIDPDEIRKSITGRTKAILPVHFAGRPCDMDSIREIADEYGLAVIEDGAHALGAAYKERKIGSLSDMTVFSFHPVKPITTGEGGVIVTDSESYYKKLILFRGHGITRGEDQMAGLSEGGWYYEQTELGFNYRMTDMQAALGVSQMDKLDGFTEKRKNIVKRYQEAFRCVKGLEIPEETAGYDSSWHLYVVQITGKDRKQVFDLLRSAGIGVNVHYIPVYHHPYYRSHGYAGTVCRNAENYYKRAISLPLYPSLTKEEQDYVINQVIYAVK